MVNNKKTRTVAAKTFEPSDYKNNNELEAGLAVTHEQVSDTLTEGTVDGEIDNVNGKDLPLRD